MADGGYQDIFQGVCLKKWIWLISFMNYVWRKFRSGRVGCEKRKTEK